MCHHRCDLRAREDGRAYAGCVERRSRVGWEERTGGQRHHTYLRQKSPAAKVEYVRTDISRQADVRMLAETITLRHQSIDILINNAGARFDVYGESADGIERTFATNHLGHFLLTSLLADPLTHAPVARVITVSSSSHVDASSHGPWCMTRADYNRRLAYSTSKLANVMFAYELAERLKTTRVTSNAIDPGVVATNFARNNGMVAGCAIWARIALRRELISPRNGAQPLIYLAVANELAGVTGSHFQRNCEARSSPAC